MVYVSIILICFYLWYMFLAQCMVQWILCEVLCLNLSHDADRCDWQCDSHCEFCHPDNMWFYTILMLFIDNFLVAYVMLGEIFIGSSRHYRELNIWEMLFKMSWHSLGLPDFMRSLTFGCPFVFTGLTLYRLKHLGHFGCRIFVVAMPYFDHRISVVATPYFGRRITVVATPHYGRRICAVAILYFGCIISVAATPHFGRWISAIATPCFLHRISAVVTPHCGRWSCGCWSVFWWCCHVIPHHNPTAALTVQLRCSKSWVSTWRSTPVHRPFCAPRGRGSLACHSTARGWWRACLRVSGASRFCCRIWRPTSSPHFSCYPMMCRWVIAMQMLESRLLSPINWRRPGSTVVLMSVAAMKIFVVVKVIWKDAFPVPWWNWCWHLLLSAQWLEGLMVWWWTLSQHWKKAAICLRAQF